MPGPVAKYAEAAIYAELHREIAAMAAGEPVPSVRRLMARFGVSQAIVARVLERLRQELPIVAEVGRGSFKGGADAAARLLVKLVMNDAESFWQEDLEKAVSRTFAGHGYRVMVSRYRWDRFPSRFEITPDTAGLLIVPPSYLSGRQLSLIERLSVPAVLLDLVPHGVRLHGVASDNEFGGALAADHLGRQGARRLAVLSGEPEISPNVHARIRGFRRQCQLAGLPDPLVFDGHVPMGADPVESAYHVAQQALNAGAASCHGIFAISAPTAQGVLRACRERRIAIPDDLLLVAFDETPESAAASPPLTVIEQDVAAWAREAVAIIDAGRQGLLGCKPHYVHVLPRLIARASTRSLSPNPALVQPAEVTV